jgi:hypothetical protein
VSKVLSERRREAACLHVECVLELEADVIHAIVLQVVEDHRRHTYSARELHRL